MDIINCLNLFFNKLIKNRLSLILIIFSFFLFNPLDSFAFDIYFYGSNYSDLGHCSGLNWCIPNNPNNEDIIGIRVQDNYYQIISDSNYNVNQTFKVWNKKNDFSINDDALVYAGSIRPNTITYNAKNSYEFDDFGNTYIINYGVANTFTSQTASIGYFYEFYFPKAMQISRFELIQWDIINTGSTTGDIINNSTNTIIDNNNKNTQDIIDNQDKNTDKIVDNIDDLEKNLFDDEPLSESVIEEFFDGIGANFATDTPISDLLLMPLTLLESYSDGISSSCASFNLGELLGTDLIMPCVDLESLLGSTAWKLIDSLISIFMFYNIAMLCVSIFDSITSLDDSFQLLYSPKHGEMSRVGIGHSRGLY